MLGSRTARDGWASRRIGMIIAEAQRHRREENIAETLIIGVRDERYSGFPIDSEIARALFADLILAARRQEDNAELEAESALSKEDLRELLARTRSVMESAAATLEALAAEVERIEDDRTVVLRLG